MKKGKRWEEDNVEERESREREKDEAVTVQRKWRGRKEGGRGEGGRACVEEKTAREAVKGWEQQGSQEVRKHENLQQTGLCTQSVHILCLQFTSEVFYLFV